MAKIHQLGNRFIFVCPGCNAEHAFQSGSEFGPNWIFNGDFNKPTFSPSLLYNAERRNPAVPQCHLYVKNGMIEFLSDCTHNLAGKTVPMKDVR